jgi:hypothetical protein
MSHRLIISSTLLLFVIFSPLKALADFTLNSESSREAIVNSSRTKKFYSLDRVSSMVALGGSYDSDQNSKQYQLTSRYFYQSKRFINEVNFVREKEYTDRGTGKNKRYKALTSDLFDLSISNKIRLFDTNNYTAFYHRTVYDRLSTYYYDNQTALGFGRIFFNDKLEFDVSLGYQSTKNFGEKLNVIPSIRLNIKITDKLTLNQRGYWFINDRSTDSDLRTSLVYRLGRRTSFEIRHTFETRRYYGNTASSSEINQVRKLLTFGFIFDLN